MIPGNPRILTCPKCGGRKNVLSLVSGNTLDAISWSDTKRDAPMLPTVSIVQKCPHCGHYFFTNKQPAKYSDRDDFTMELGTLNFEECKEAIAQFKDEPLEEMDEFNIRLLALHAHNDKFHRKYPKYFESIGSRKYSVKPEDPSEQDIAFFRDNVQTMIGMLADDGGNDIFKAELYREVGDFDKCISILNSFSTPVEYLECVKQQVLQHALEKKTTVFILE